MSVSDEQIKAEARQRYGSMVQTAGARLAWTKGAQWMREQQTPGTPSPPQTEPGLNRFYILIKPWAVYVKEGDFFVEQGGLTEPWGSEWRIVMARDVDHAREIGKSRQAEGDVSGVR